MYIRYVYSQIGFTEIMTQLWARRNFQFLLSFLQFSQLASLALKWPEYFHLNCSRLLPVWVRGRRCSHPLLIAVTWGGGYYQGLEERVNSSWIITFAVSCGFFASKSFFLCEHKYRKFFDSSVKWQAKDCFESCSMMKESHQHLSLHMSVPSLKFKMKMKVL